MAISFAQTYTRNSAGVFWEILGTLSLDSSYPAGGYDVSPLQFGLSQVTSFTVSDAQGGYLYDYDASNEKLIVYESAAASGLTFNGNALAGHTHTISNASENGTPASFRVYVGSISGPFTIGETLTGGTSAATGTLLSTGVNRFGYDYFEYTPTTGAMFSFNEVLTGGTSGETAATTSLGVGVVTPLNVPVAMMGLHVSNSGTDSDVLNAMVMVANNSRLRTTLTSTYDDVENNIQLAITNSGQNFGMTYLTGTTSSISAGTPTGSITGGSATGLVEVAPGTDLSLVTGIEYRAVGL